MKRRATNKLFSLFIFRTAGGSMLGDVNISAILDSFSVSYDKRVRPNYGGMYFLLILSLQYFDFYLFVLVPISPQKLKKKRNIYL